MAVVIGKSQVRSGIALITFMAISVTMETAAEARVAKSTADSKCSPGTGPDGPSGEWSGGLNSTGGLTPLTIPGATRVTPKEANCLFTAYEGKLLFITPVGDPSLIPMTYRVARGGAGGSLNDDIQKSVADRLAVITKGDRDMPLVSYCHHIQCYLSYNLALRAIKAGYRNIYWLRSGLVGWRAAGGPFVPGDVEGLAKDAERREAQAIAKKAEHDFKRAEEDVLLDRKLAQENARRRAVQEARLGTEDRVTTANSFADKSTGLRLFIHDFRLVGRRGDRFLISVRQDQGYPPRLESTLEQFVGDADSKFVDSKTTWSSDGTIFAPRASVTFELPADGVYYYAIGQTAFTGIGTSAIRDVDPNPYFVKVERLR